MIIGDALLMSETLLYPDRDVSRYQNLLNKLGEQVLVYRNALLRQNVPDDVGSILASLKKVIELDEGIASKPSDNDSCLSHLTLIGALDERTAHDSILAALYSDVAARAGYDVQLISIPSMFLMRASYKGQVMLFDPAQGCLVLQAHSIRARLKQDFGRDVELSSDFFDPMSRRDAVVSVQNALKTYLIANEDYSWALELVSAMRVLVPSEYRLLLDAGVLYARTQQTEAAVFALRGYIEKAPDNQTRLEAQNLLNDLLGMLK